MWGDKRAHGVQVSQNLNGAGDKITREDYCLTVFTTNVLHICAPPPPFFLKYITNIRLNQPTLTTPYAYLCFSGFQFQCYKIT